MTRMTKFADAFWETDFVGTKGFDALVKRMRIGRNTCKDLFDFFKERASIEKDYAGKLQKLAKSVEKKAHCSDESKTLDKAVAALFHQSERAAAIHTEAAKAYHDRLEKLREFSDTQKDEKKKVEENLKKSQNGKINQYNRTMSLQKTYQSKCRERDHLKSQFESASQSVTMQAKDKDKLKQRYDRAETAMDQADEAYRNSVHLLEQVRLSWEKEMEDSCAKFQCLEESRIDFLRSEMWLHCNILSQTCVDVDESCEQTRLDLEKCCIEEDIADFIMDAHTGCDRPAKIVYENYHTGGKKSLTPTEGWRPAPKPSPALPPRGSPHNITYEGDYATVE